MSHEPKDATPATGTANREAAARYDMADRLGGMLHEYQHAV